MDKYERGIRFFFFFVDECLSVVCKREKETTNQDLIDKRRQIENYIKTA